MNEQEIIDRVKTLHPYATIDVAGEDCNFELFVISPGFSGQNTLQRQKPILALFREDIRSGDLHALTIYARTPEEHSGTGGLVQISL